jgi:hypothetical protein
MPSARRLPGKPNKGQTLGFHPGNLDSALEEHEHKLSPQVLPRSLLQGIKHTTHIKKPRMPIFIGTSTPLCHYKLPIVATKTFSTSINTLEIKS